MRTAAFTFCFCLLATLNFSSCDDTEEVEVIGVVQDVGLNTVTIDGILYTIDDNTEYGGLFTTMQDVTVGQAVNIEYVERAGNRIIVEIEEEAAVVQ